MSGGHGNETRYDGPPVQIEKARSSAPGPGVFVNYRTSFCAMCRTDKPKAGSKKRGALYVCADCLSRRVLEQGGQASGVVDGITDAVEARVSQLQTDMRDAQGAWSDARNQQALPKASVSTGGREASPVLDRYDHATSYTECRPSVGQS